MKLSALIRGIDIVSRRSFADVEITGISTDTRSLRPGDLFVAVRGRSVDGHRFIAEAISCGAAALVVDRPVESTLPVVIVRDSAAAAAHAAKSFFGDPAASLRLVGITGTNGKTSTAFLLQSILHGALGPTGIIGTVGYGAAGTLQAATHTTPAAVDLYRILDDFGRRGCTAAVMEVSSHAVDQGRIHGLEFDVGVVTNVSRDHLDYHGTMEAYLAAKEAFIATLVRSDRAKGPGKLAYNRDDPAAVAIAGRFPGESVSFGSAGEADVGARDVRSDMTGNRFTLEIEGRRSEVSLPLLGGFAVSNALASAAAAHILGVPLSEITSGLERAPVVPGRFQVIGRGKGPVVIVDYAHTPDAIEKLLSFCRELRPERLLTVFGCGGDRDRGKRPLMGRVASRLSDIVFVTSDNPRSERPRAIIDEILAGIEAGAQCRIVEDRRQAIRDAIAEARAGDIVVVAGKGHEREQIVGDRRLPFSDAQEAEAALRGAEVDHTR